MQRKIGVLLPPLLATIYIFLIMASNLPAKANWLAAAIIGACLMGMIPYVIKSKSFTVYFNSAFIVIFFIAVELVFYVRLYEHPALKTYTLPSAEARQRVEFLDRSPYFKFKPNMRIVSMGDRGADFTWDWVTDLHGFKNTPEIAAFERYDFLALGDSFTEGMGVGTEDTWASILSSNYGVRVYNAGVQGYAALQMLGTLKLLKDKISFDGIIVGALPTIYHREGSFLDKERIVGATGGIESIRMNRVGRVDYFLPGLLRLVQINVQALFFTKVANNSHSNLTQYSHEVTKPDDITVLKENKNWKSYINSFDSIISWAEKNNKKIYIMQFPPRSEVYFEPADFGLRQLEGVQYYVELTLLKEHFGSRASFVDLLKPLREHYRSAPKDIPYFMIDGHMNERGNLIVAEEFFNHLKAR